HVLEHVPEPIDFLNKIAQLLEPGGRIFIEVPNLAENPFDLLVADHCSHFLPETLATVERRLSLIVKAMATSWASKEISLVLVSVADPAKSGRAADSGRGPMFAVKQPLAWLSHLLEQARELAQQGPLGVFGTSTAGTWMGTMLGDRIAFF